MQIGVIVGRQSSQNKDYVLHIIPTPQEEDNDPVISIEKRKQGTSTTVKKTIVVDTEWVSEHACQLARILPGGLCVLGVYVSCEADAFQESQGTLASLLKSINNEILYTKKKVEVIMHIDSVKGVMTGKEVDGTSLKPCEVKNSSLVNDMVEIQCYYPIHAVLDVIDGKQILCDVIDGVISWEVEHRVKPAIPMVHGHVPVTQQQILEFVKHEGLGHIPIELMIPCGGRSGPPVFPRSAQGESTMAGKYQSKVRLELHGLMECRAYVHKRESAQAAVDAIKEDIDLSLRSRLEVLVEAAEMATEAMEQQQKASAQKQQSNGTPYEQPRHPLLDESTKAIKYEPHLPRRAFLKWKQGSCCYCDYVVEGDGMSEALHRMKELVGEGKVDGTTFQCKETAMSIHAKAGNQLTDRRKHSRVSNTRICTIMLLGILACLVFLALAWFS